MSGKTFTMEKFPGGEISREIFLGKISEEGKISGGNIRIPIVRAKWYWTKWYGQNCMDKMVRIRLYQKTINQYINRTPIDYVILTSILLPL